MIDRDTLEILIISITVGAAAAACMYIFLDVVLNFKGKK